MNKPTPAWVSFIDKMGKKQEDNMDDKSFLRTTVPEVQRHSKSWETAVQDSKDALKAGGSGDTVYIYQYVGKVTLNEQFTVVNAEDVLCTS